MSERSYFSLRWAIPGYTFILLVIVMNYRVLIQSIQEVTGVPEFSELFFGFLALLSGSAIGFLVSQVWAVLSELLCLSYGHKKPRRPYKILIDLCGLTDRTAREDKRKVSAVYCYVLSSEAERQKGAVEFTTRRWDLHNLFGSEMVSLLMGLVFGWIIRLVSAYYLNKPFTFWSVSNWWNATESWVLLFTSIFSVFFLVVTWIGINRVDKQYDLIAEAIIRKGYHQGNLRRENLERIFPRHCFVWPLTIIEGIEEEKAAILKEAGICSVYQLSIYDIEKDPKKVLASKKIDSDQISVCVEKAKEFLSE